MTIASDTLAVEGPFVGDIARLRRLVSRWRFVACVQTLDFIVLVILGLLWLRVFAPEPLLYGRWVHLLVAALAAATINCVFQCFRLYDFKIVTCGPEGAFRVFAAEVMSFGPFLAPVLYQADASVRPGMGVCALIVGGLLVLPAARLGFARVATIFLEYGMISRRLYIITDTAAAAASFKSALERSHDNTVVGIWELTDRYDAAKPMEVALEGALDFLRTHPVDAVILKLPVSQRNRLEEAARVLRGLPRQILLAPSFDDGDDVIPYSEWKQNASIETLADMALMKISDRPLAGWSWVRKDLQDRIIALLLLAVLSPVMIMIVIAIKLSGHGPVFFRQRRLGYGGETFEIIKFRTMRVSDNFKDAAGLQLTARDDPRVFPLGRILRKTSLDELPQLLNVLKGDMWIVGPRPHSPYAKACGIVYARAVQEYAARYRIKPGITGWAQVCGWRGPTESLDQLRKRVEHDLYYIDNWSTLFDMRILLKTLFCAFGHENAF